MPRRTIDELHNEGIRLWNKAFVFRRQDDTSQAIRRLYHRWERLNLFSAPIMACIIATVQNYGPGPILAASDDFLRQVLLQAARRCEYGANGV